MNAYDKSYLEDAMDNLGTMADYGVNTLGISESEFWSRFLASGLAARFSAGAPDIISGHSGTELAMMVMKETGRELAGSYSSVSISSPQYWAGWALAWYQWLKGYSFKELSKTGLDLHSVSRMFHPLHEADLSVFAHAADELIEKNTDYNWLKYYRKQNRMTQEQLSEKSGVPIRLIRAYEQGTIDTEKAEYRTISRLLHTLHIAVMTFS